MPRGAIASSGSSGERISHYGGVTLRVNGIGNLQMRFLSLDDEYTSNMLNFPMATIASKELTRLGNFTNQRAFLELKTTEINEVFRINRIIVWTRTVATQYPQ